MAVSEQTGPVTDPQECASGREFARDRLAEADSPLSPAELRDEYGCVGGHMRNILSDLVSEGVAERVATGRYVLADDSESDSGGDTDGSYSVISDEDTADLPSENTSEDVSDQMPTQGEYQRQHDGLGDGSADESGASELTVSDGNSSSAGGSDAPDEDDPDSTGAGAGAVGAAALGGGASMLGEDGPSGRQVAVFVLAILGMWLLYRKLGTTSDGSNESNDSGADEASGEVEGGLYNS